MKWMENRNGVGSRKGREVNEKGMGKTRAERRGEEMKEKKGRGEEH